MEPTEVIRFYNGSDAFMTETANVNHQLFVDDLVVFKTFDSTMDNDFATAYMASVVAAQTVVADSSVIDQQVTLTENADAQMELARIKYTQVKYFVLKAFPNSLGTQGEFGLNDYIKARRSKTQMGQFLFEMYTACDKYSTELIAAGYNQAGIDSILPVRTALMGNTISQKVFEKQRPKLTEDRIIILNDCYKSMVQINAAAQIVYMDDYAKQKQFVYLPSSQTDDSVEFTGILPAEMTAIVGKVPYKASSLVTFKNTGLTPLLFSLSIDDQLSGEIVSLEAGMEEVRDMETLLVNGTNVIVKNGDLLAEGNYFVKVKF